jgi:ubiquinone/menaquinone biosynthesis C-methylase UbiE
MRGVDSKLYTTEYFLTENAGWEEFQRSCGATLDERYKRALALANLKPDMEILDLGCGRGELVINCARNGMRATGIDYSASAIELAQKALQMYPEEISSKVRLLHLDTKSVAFPAESFDCIFLLDFAEHLYPEELSLALSNSFYYLKKGGKLIIHTAPNKLFFIGYAYWRFMRTFLNILLGRKERPPRNPRNEYQMAMHVNEMSPFELKSYLKKSGFSNFTIRLNSYGWLGVRWIGAPLTNPRVLLGRIILELFPFSMICPLRLFFYDSIWCVARK